METISIYIVVKIMNMDEITLELGRKYRAGNKGQSLGKQLMFRESAGKGKAKGRVRERREKWWRALS